MPTSTITSKGQITLPKAIRDALGVEPGDRVMFRVRDDGSVLVEAATIDLLSLAGSVRTTIRGVTLEDMEEAIAAGALASAGFAPAVAEDGPTLPECSPGRPVA